MEILDSVAAEDVPAAARPLSKGAGTWTGLAEKAISDWQVGKVTVVMMKDAAEFKRMRNGMSDYMRQRKFRPLYRSFEESGGLRIYIAVEPREPPLEVTRSKPAEAQPVRRISIGGNRNNAKR